MFNISKGIINIMKQVNSIGLNCLQYLYQYRKSQNELLDLLKNMNLGLNVSKSEPLGNVIQVKSITKSNNFYWIKNITF